MQYLERTITGVDGTAVTLRGYVIDNSEEMASSRRRPAVLIIPGGGYEMTSDREAEPIALAMLGFGFHAFVLRYSVAPSRYPVALLEAAEAMRTIRDHADAWHVDAQAVVAAGFSAGGHLAASLGTSGADDILEAHGYAPSDIRPDGLMLGYPVITSGEYAHRGSFAALLGDRRDDPAMLRRLSLEHQVSDATPPTFIWHTVPDSSVPVHNTMLFVNALIAHHVPVETHLFPSGGHGLSLGTADTARRNGVGVEECVQIWPELFRRWMRRNFACHAE